MRKVNIGGKEYKVVASPITLYFYKKEFKRDLLGDLMGLFEMKEDTSKFDGIGILQMAWAMIKTAKGGQLIAFEQWMNELEFVDFNDESLMLDITEEAQQEFFREKRKTGELQQEQQKQQQ